jgi:hypothetical protein
MPEPKKKTEAEIAVEMLETYKNVDGKLTTIDETIKSLSEKHAKMEGLDAKAIGDEFEKLKAGIEEMKKQVAAHGTGGAYLPGLGESKEAKNFSITKLAWAQKTGNWEEAGVEKEVMKTSKEWVQKNVVGIDTSAGSFVLDQAMPDIIVEAYRQSALISLNPATGQTRVRVMNGLTGGKVTVGKFKGGSIAYWIGENDEYIETMARTAEAAFFPKKLTVLTKLTEETRKFAPGFESLMRQDMVNALSSKLDHTALYGSGTDNEPRGLMRMKGIKRYRAETGETIGSNTVVTGAVGAYLGFDGMSEMQAVADDNNKSVSPSAAWVAAAQWYRRLKRIKSKNYTGQPDNEAPYLLGAPMLSDARLTETIGDWVKHRQISTTLTAGQDAGWLPADATDTNFTDVFYGDWSEFIFARWGVMNFVSDEGKGLGFTRDQILLKGNLYCDMNVREEETFVICPDARVRDKAA